MRQTTVLDFRAYLCNTPWSMRDNPDILSFRCKGLQVSLSLLRSERFRFRLKGLSINRRRGSKVLQVRYQLSLFFHLVRYSKCVHSRTAVLFSICTDETISSSLFRESPISACLGVLPFGIVVEPSFLAPKMLGC